MKNSTKYLSIIVSLVVIIFIITKWFYKENSSTIFSKQLVFWDLENSFAENIKISNAYRQNINGIVIDELTATCNNNKIDLTYFNNFPVNKALQYLEDRKVQILSLFDPKIDPYFQSASTGKIICQNKYKPIINEVHNKKMDLISFFIYANDRYGIGVCADDLVKYRAEIILMYCHDREKLFHFKIFSSSTENNKFYDKL